MKQQGLNVIMLTGDIDIQPRLFRKLLVSINSLPKRYPADKLAKISDLQSQKRVVAMVGDGINDAPVWPRPM